MPISKHKKKNITGNEWIKRKNRRISALRYQQSPKRKKQKEGVQNG